MLYDFSEILNLCGISVIICNNSEFSAEIYLGTELYEDYYCRRR